MRSVNFSDLRNSRLSDPRGSRHLPLDDFSVHSDTSEPFIPLHLRPFNLSPTVDWLSKNLAVNGLFHVTTRSAPTPSETLKLLDSAAATIVPPISEGASDGSVQCSQPKSCKGRLLCDSSLHQLFYILSCGHSLITQVSPPHLGVHCALSSTASKLQSYLNDFASYAQCLLEQRLTIAKGLRASLDLINLVGCDTDAAQIIARGNISEIRDLPGLNIDEPSVANSISDIDQGPLSFVAAHGMMTELQLHSDFKGLLHQKSESYTQELLDLRLQEYADFEKDVSDVITSYNKQDICKSLQRDFRGQGTRLRVLTRDYCARQGTESAFHKLQLELEVESGLLIASSNQCWLIWALYQELFDLIAKNTCWPREGLIHSATLKELTRLLEQNTNHSLSNFANNNYFEEQIPERPKVSLEAITSCMQDHGQLDITGDCYDSDNLGLGVAISLLTAVCSALAESRNENLAVRQETEALALPTVTTEEPSNSPNSEQTSERNNNKSVALKRIVTPEGIETNSDTHLAQESPARPS